MKNLNRSISTDSEKIQDLLTTRKKLTGNICSRKCAKVAIIFLILILVGIAVAVIIIFSTYNSSPPCPYSTTSSGCLNNWDLLQSCPDQCRSQLQSISDRSSSLNELCSTQVNIQSCQIDAEIKKWCPNECRNFLPTSSETVDIHKFCASFVSLRVCRNSTAAVNRYYRTLCPEECDNACKYVATTSTCQNGFIKKKCNESCLQPETKRKIWPWGFCYRPRVEKRQTVGYSFELAPVPEALREVVESGKKKYSERKVVKEETPGLIVEGDMLIAEEKNEG